MYRLLALHCATSRFLSVGAGLGLQPQRLLNADTINAPVGDHRPIQRDALVRTDEIESASHRLLHARPYNDPADGLLPECSF